MRETSKLGNRTLRLPIYICIPFYFNVFFYFLFIFYFYFVLHTLSSQSYESWKKKKKKKKKIKKKIKKKRKKEKKKNFNVKAERLLSKLKCKGGCNLQNYHGTAAHFAFFTLGIRTWGFFSKFRLKITLYEESTVLDPAFCWTQKMKKGVGASAIV